MSIKQKNLLQLELNKIEDIASGKSPIIVKKKIPKTKIINPYSGKKLLHIRLVDSGNIDIFEIPSEIEPDGSKEAEQLKMFNKSYQFLTEGDGKARPRGEAETQTQLVYAKPKSTTTEIQNDDKGTNVRNFDIFDTFSNIDKVSIANKPVRDIETLSENKNFYRLVLNMERILAENVFRQQIKMYKDMISMPYSAQHAHNLFNLHPLWTLNWPNAADRNRHVVSMSWSDELVAVGYGDFIASDEHNNDGLVAVWNYKNPVNPERKYKFPIAVCDVAFSIKNRQLLAISFYDGSLKVLDITEFTPIDSTNLPITAQTDEETKKNSTAVLQINWIEVGSVECIFTASIDGSVIKYQIGSGGRMSGSQHISIGRVEGIVEGLAGVEHSKHFVESERFAKILSMKQHPKRLSEFMIGTDEGCVYTCSAVFINKCLSQIQAQQHRIDSIDFSPFIASVYLTAGIDYKIRVWMEDVLEPLMEFGDRFASFLCVKWSRIHPTIVVSLSHDGLRIWDLKVKAERPILVQNFDFQPTIFDFSPSGTSILVGDINGKVHVFYFYDFCPEAPENPGKQLKKCIYEALRGHEKLTILDQVKKLFKCKKFNINGEK